MHTGGHEELTALVWRCWSEDQWGGGGVSPHLPCGLWELNSGCWLGRNYLAELSPGFTIVSVKFISAQLLCFLGILTASNLGSLHFFNLCRWFLGVPGAQPMSHSLL